MENTNSYHNQTEVTVHLQTSCALEHKSTIKKTHSAKEHTNLISFPVTESAPENFHSILRGGDSMEIKHEHPVYASEEERKARLLDLKKACVAKLAALNKTPVKTA